MPESQKSSSATRLRADKLALQDQILAILEDAGGFPKSTREIAAALGRHPVGTKHGCPSCECGPSHMVPYMAWSLWPELERMRKHGIVGKDKLPGFRDVFWRLT